MKNIAFAYYGGKHGLCEKIIDLMPVHSHYIEPFAGSYVVGLNKPMSPIETLNDINADIVTFFRVLREQPAALINALQLTPYARSEFEAAWQPCPTNEIEQARRFFIRVTMDVAKTGRRSDKSWSKNLKHKPSEFSYAPHNFFSKVEGLSSVANRLRNVQVECSPAGSVLRKYDSPESLFYCDPPYTPDARKSKKDYKFEMSIPDHEELLQTLLNITGKVILSGYDNPLYKSMLKGWTKIQFEQKQVPMSKGNGRATREILWLNFDPSLEVRKQLSLNL